MYRFFVDFELVVQKMATLTHKQKWDIISSWKTTNSKRTTATTLGISVKTVTKWIQRYEATGDVASVKRPGPKVTMTEEACAIGMDLLLNPDYGSATSVASELYARGLTSRLLHRTTVAYNLKRFAKKQGSALKSYRGKPAQDISKASKEKRIAFCHKNRKRSWKNVMFTDRKKFLFKHPGVHVRSVQWASKGHRPQAYSVNHPMAVNVYAGITWYGVTRCHVVAGTSKHKSTFSNKKGEVSKNITAAEYETVLKNTFLPGGSKLFTANGISHWVLQQDNDPTHKAAPDVTKSWSNNHNSSPTVLADWPPSSPDLNLIENCWAYVQRKVDGQGHKTFEDFMAAVKYEVENIPLSMLRNLYKSMPKRVARVLELGGERLAC
jgi:transposase